MLNYMRADPKALRLAFPLTGVIALAAALGGCGETDVTKLLLPKATPRCTDAFASDRFAAAPASGAVEGPAVAFIRRDDSKIEEQYRHYAKSTWAEYRIAPEHARPTSADAVRAVICVQVVYTEVGTYEVYSSSGPISFSGWVPAARVDWDVRIIRWPSGDPVAAKVFQGQSPSERTSTSSSGKFVSGSEPRGEGVKWIEGVIRR